MMLTIALRIAHIVGGVLWVGFAVFAGLLLMPSVQDAGPAGGKVMAALQARGIGTIPPILALITLGSGVWLYWNLTAGFTPSVVTSPPGLAYGAGGILAIVGFAVGMAVLRPSMLRAGALARQLAETPDDTQRAALAAELNQLRNRGGRAGRFVGVTLIIATAAMAAARYL